MQTGQEPPEAEGAEQEEPGTFELVISKEGLTLNGQPTELRAALEQIVAAFEKVQMDGGDQFEAGLKDTSQGRQKPVPPANVMVR